MRELPVVRISAARVGDFDAARAVSSGADFYVKGATVVARFPAILPP